MSRKPKALAYVPMPTDAHEMDEILDFAERLGLKTACALGHYQALWAYVGRQCLAGHLPQMSSARIARLCLWDGDAEDFRAALFDARWLSQHDSGQGWWLERWDEHAGKALEKRAKGAERKAKHDAKKRANRRMDKPQAIRGNALPVGYPSREDKDKDKELRDIEQPFQRRPVAARSPVDVPLREPAAAASRDRPGSNALQQAPGMQSNAPMTHCAKHVAAEEPGGPPSRSPAATAENSPWEPRRALPMSVHPPAHEKPAGEPYGAHGHDGSPPGNPGPGILPADHPEAPVGLPQLMDFVGCGARMLPTNIGGTVQERLRALARDGCVNADLGRALARISDYEKRYARPVGLRLATEMLGDAVAARRRQRDHGWRAAADAPPPGSQHPSMKMMEDSTEFLSGYAYRQEQAELKAAREAAEEAARQETAAEDEGQDDDGPAARSADEVTHEG